MRVNVPAAEITAVETYLSQKGINNAQKSTFGFYYKVEAPGSGATPTLCSNISIKYLGKLVNDSIFDQSLTTPVTFNLARLISGWQYGIPLIKPGGSIILYLPPSLAYGDNPDPRSGIPPNSVLIFEVQLISVG